LYENLFDFYGYGIFVPVLGCSCFSILISPPPPGRLPRDPVPSFHFFVPGFSAARAARSSCFGFCSQFRVCRRLFCRSDCFSHVMCRTPAEGSRFLLGLSITRQERSQVRAVFPPVWIPCHSYFFAAAGIRFGCGPFSRTESLPSQLRFQVSVCIMLEHAQEPFFSAAV
jgi:hypothetical protein